MPLVENHGVKIHYQVEGGGPPLILQHGSTSSLQAWYTNGYVEPLKRKFRVILVDARGHGASDKPHERADYTVALRAGDILAVMDALGIARAHYLGYSMGAWIGFGLAGRAPERFLSMALGGAHPYFESGAAFHGVDGSDPEALIAAMERFVGNPMTPERQAQIRASDTRALAAAMHDRASQEHVLPAMTMPCLLYSGGNDPRHDKIEQCAARMPNARFVSFPGHTHSGLNMRADIVLPALMAFWNEVGVVQS